MAEPLEERSLRALRPCLPECMVLLRTNGAFPLEAPGELALYGSGARHTIKGGTGSGEVNSRYFVTVEQGLEQAGFHITTKAWLDAYDAVLVRAKEAFLREIRRRARERHVQAVLEGMGQSMPEPEYDLPLDGAGDTAVYVLSRISGEGSDREVVPGDVLLSGTERRDILALQAKYDRFLLVLNVGGPVDLSGLEAVGNILVLSQLGVEMGCAFADVLLGRAYPSGKLTATWPSGQDCAGPGDFGDRFDTRYREGIYVGYRYYDTAGVRPVYPFGFGLGYTTFSLETTGLTLEGERLAVQVRVTNTGTRPGREVAQMYLSCPSGRLDRPFQELAGWAKTEEIPPGQSRTVEISCRLSDLAAFDTAGSRYVLESGDYGVRIGSSSGDTVCVGVVAVPEERTVRTVERCFPDQDFADWRPEHSPARDIPDSLPRLTLDPDAIAPERVVYETEAPQPEPFVHNLTLEQLAACSVGAFNPKGGVMNIIGDASRTVSGAAGETNGALREEGFPGMVLADGPAGLRLSRDYILDKKGRARAIGFTMPETIEELMPKAVLWFLRKTVPKPKKGQTIYHHYMTQIPIGTAVAQSWNLELAQLCGDVVGQEMERTGVHLWLAPALNIHRSIRCGRSFEYYSEDPLVSGKFAAAMTRGVQAHKGRGTTIKHFAANNQETNRYGNNSRVSERALREIYLKGFGICVREAQPCAVMTSYNLLDGEHTSEHRGLIERVLRREYGFRGIVMTDWIVAQMRSGDDRHPSPNAGKIAAAGGDLVMPGCQGNVREILDAVRAGTLSRGQLEENVTRVYRMARKLNGLDEP